MDDIRVTTDMKEYHSGQTVRIIVYNQTEHNTFIWIGPCSLVLFESQEGNLWTPTPNPWSLCSFCGEQREMPAPLFLNPEDSQEIEWDQKVSWCEDDDVKTKPALGRFRFSFQYAEDDLGCQSAQDPFECWENYREKKWLNVFSDELIITESGD